MSNPSKSKGTHFETAVARWMSDRLGDPVERRALHGSRDMGDLFGLRAHGLSGIAECKAHASVTPRLVAEWRRQTLAERGNADAGFALLVIKLPGVGAGSMWRTRVDLTMRDLARISLPIQINDGWLDAADDVWVTLDLEGACALMAGEHER